MLIPNKIVLQDGFKLLDLQEKAANGEYKNEEQIVMDLLTLLVHYEGETEDIYAIKGYDGICDSQKYASKFVKKGSKFTSKDLKTLTVFQGQKYKKLNTIDYECLQMYFDLIKETIAAGDERIYEYILNLIAWMIQNPGKKFRAAIVLQNRYGIGKNRFTDVIAELTNRYCCSNVTNIDEFTR
ncbi:MAG: hypothetical protein EZS28_031284 [Streblomastix strix]|uniref:Uncharacterized protein n=1 Tax=Streblomastix strix TaxID=222440 RepID=A0A5J4US15_9EUKA|nr:MAG: hypothetical protein EZS28_031284 [Streblomastix strix]